MLYRRIIRKSRSVTRKAQFQICLKNQLGTRWQNDCQQLPLSENHRPLYDAIHKAYWVNQKNAPNIACGQTFNDKIQWLKLFGQDARMVELTDKLALKKVVDATLGEGYVARTLAQADRYQALDQKDLPSQFVLKANHDSGSVFFVHDKYHFPARYFQYRLDRAVQRTYGRSGAEWQYWPIRKQVFAEEMLPFDKGAPPPDFKFHCANGQVLWFQYIYNRGRHTKEVITDRDGKVMGIAFDESMTSVFNFQRPGNWWALVEVAETLSQGFPYVRVDLYNLPGRIVVGEMTFTPKKGMYQSKGNIELGKLLHLDRTNVRELVCAEYPGRPSKWRW